MTLRTTITGWITLMKVIAETTKRLIQITVLTKRAVEFCS